MASWPYPKAVLGLNVNEDPQDQEISSDSALHEHTHTYIAWLTQPIY